jgi:very-short-patch-repair endonuclease
MKPVERAREMRKALTPPEARLWSCLEWLRAEGFHFRRQAPFRGYLLDFVCHSRRLVIEVDGQTHTARFEHDRVRDSVLEREGYRTIRYTNAAVRDKQDAVVRGIRAALGADLSQPW